MAFGKFGKYYPGGVDVRLEMVDLISSLHQAVETVRSKDASCHDIRIAAPHPSCCVMTDRLHLHYILMNLLLNATKYSPARSRIDVEVELRAEHISVAVIDQGIGIPQAEVEQVFSPFFRASNVGEVSGTGMGLAIVKKSARLIGARLSIALGVSCGTRVTVLLPTAVAQLTLCP